MCEDKWLYIGKISQLSREYQCDYLIDLMDKYNKPNLKEITFNEAKSFYDSNVEKLSKMRYRNVGGIFYYGKHLLSGIYEKHI